MLAVIGFHAFPTWVRGGFVGVDIFFVISGYLISGILLGSLEKGTFSIGDFYARRVRRIFPALSLILIGTYLFGCLVLMKDELDTLGEHVGAGAGFISNLVLWNEAGYFDAQAEMKPLLHLWSLGIEEQFYIVWPPLLYATWRYRLDLKWSLLVLALVSFSLNVRGVVTGDRTQSFYSPLTRLWELLAGGALAHASRRASTNHVLRPIEREIKGLAGVLLIAAAILFVNPERAFPGGWALLPTLGALLVISAGSKAWVNRTILSQRAVVYVGLISFPLYLWHWPLFSFALIYGGRAWSTPLVRALLSLVSFGLAAATYAFVERPIRGWQLDKQKARWIVAVSCAVVGAIGLAGFFRLGTSRIAHRLPASLTLGKELKENTTQDAEVAWIDATHATQMLTDKRQSPRYAVWGDSKAYAMYPGLVRTSADGQRWRLVNRPSCSPLTGFARVTFYGDNGEACLASNKFALKALVGDDRLKVVLLVASARVLTDPGYARHFGEPPLAGAAFEGLSSSISRLMESGKKVIFLIDNPTLPDPRECLDRSLTPLFGDKPGRADLTKVGCSLSLVEHRRRTEAYREIVARLRVRHPSVAFFDSASVLCDDSVCPIAKDQLFLYSFGDHLSDHGNSLVAKELVPMIAAIATAVDATRGSAP